MMSKRQEKANWCLNATSKTDALKRRPDKRYPALKPHNCLIALRLSGLRT